MPQQQFDAYLTLILSLNAYQPKSYQGNRVASQGVFFWFDDSEYSCRISKKMPCYLVSDSIVFHETPENIAPLDLTQLTEKSAWKFHYGIRNQASYHFVRDGFAAGYLFCLKMLVRSFRHTNSWRMRWLVLNACWQGWRFDYEKLIEHVNQPIKSIDREARTSDQNQNI